MPVLLLKSPLGNQAHPLMEGKPLFIGRAKECDIHLASPAVSRRHAVVLLKNGVCGVKDLGSFNGTQINGATLSAPRHLDIGDVMTISSFTFTLLDEVPDESPLPAPGPETSGPIAPGPQLPKAMTPEEALEQLVADIESESLANAAIGGGDTADDTQMYMPGGSTTTVTPAAGEGEGGAEPLPAAPEPLPAGEGEADAAPEAAPPDGPVAAPLDFDDDSYFQEPSADDGAADDLAGGLPPEAADAGSRADAVFPLEEPEAEERLIVLDGADEPAAARSAPADPDTAVYSLPANDPDGDETATAEGGTEVVAGGWADFEDAVAPVPGASARRPAGTTSVGRGGVFFDAVTDSSGSARIRLGAGGDAAEPAMVEMTPALVAAIDARLSLYVLLQDLADERRLLRGRSPLSPDAEAELVRQEAELDCMPTANEAERLSLELRERWEAEGGGGARDPGLRAAEELAVAQWTLLRDSSREALPAVFREAYRLAADEPLARELAGVGINHGRLMGGAIYLIALEAVARAAGDEHNRVSSRLRAVNGDDDERGGGGGGVLGRLGRLAGSLKNRQEKREEAERLAKKVHDSAMRAELAAREMRYMERLLIREFRQVYLRTALHFVPQHERMPLAVRAFLRHGAIGFKPWWMTGAVRDHITRDCRDNVVSGFDRSAGEVAVLYADEYLAAVSRMECSPSPDEALARRGRGSVEWKSDRAYRRIVNSRTYNVLMQDVLAGLGYRRRDFGREAAEVEDRISAITSRPHGREEVDGLESRHQMLLTRCENLDKQVRRIENEVVASILAAVEEAEGRFRRGDLVMPDQATLIRREVEALGDIARRMVGSRECFMPAVIRRHAVPGADIVNDRSAVRSRLADLEELDPGVFTSTIVPAKRRYNRIELRLPPTVVLVPVAGYACVCSMGREGMEGGHLAIPTCFAKPDLRDRQMCNLLADFRWETSRHLGGLDLMGSDTLAGVFMRIRWEWRNFPKTKREKGLILTEISDGANWRRIYEVYIQDALNGGRALYLRNPEIYFSIIGRFIDLPDGVDLVKR